MALNKQDLDTTLKSLTRREVKPLDLGIETSEEIYAKLKTKVGQKDGEILGGVKSLGKESITPNEVLDTSVGKITDDIGVSGLDTPSEDANTLSGFSSNTTAKSGILAIGQGGPAGIESATKKAEEKSAATKSSISSFTSSIGGTPTTTQTPSFGDTLDAAKSVTPCVFSEWC
jgi:hypothetical protein